MGKGFDYEQMNRQFKSKVFGETSIAMTFDQDTAYQHKDLEFINAYHPLVVAAYVYFEKNKASLDKTFSLEIRRGALKDIESPISGEYFLGLYVLLSEKHLYGSSTTMELLRPVLFDINSQTIVEDEELVKTIYAQAGEHFNLNGGYGISDINPDGSYDYTPTVNSSSWLSLAYGKKTQAILFAGFVKNFGTLKDLYSGTVLKDVIDYVPASELYFSKNSFSNMNMMWRLTPTVIHNIGKFAIGLEYEVTSIQYGDYKTFAGQKYIGKNGLAQDNLHWITNNRVQALVKFTF